MQESKHDECHEEYQYLNLVQTLIDEYDRDPVNSVRKDRTGTGTISIFGYEMKFNLRKHFPLMGTKKLFWRGIVAELLWMLSGSTNAKVLADQGVHIWDQDTTRAELDKRGFKNRPEQDIGNGYGFQWRHSGADYSDCHADYTEKGIDQISNLIHEIKTNPTSRRLIVSCWDVREIKNMTLPPCHMLFQCFVKNGELSLKMTQRSADVALGLPFNIAFYALLACLLAQVCELKPGDLILSLGDTHLYQNLLEPLREQIKRMPPPFPTLMLNPDIKDIFQFTANDITLHDYNPHKAIKMKQSV